MIQNNKQVKHPHKLPSLSTLVLAAVLFIHGIVHFVGSNYPDRPLWLVTALVLLAAATGCYRGTVWWIPLFFLGFLLSQYLMLRWWSDTRIGFFINIALFLVVLMLEAAKRFDHKTASLVGELMKNYSEEPRIQISPAAIRMLPAPVQRWLHHTGAIGTAAVQLVHVKQQGRLRLSKTGSWFSFRAEQYAIPSRQMFVWDVKVFFNYIAWLRGRDFLMDGKAGLLMRGFGLIRLAKTETSHHLESAAMIRLLGEIAWCPAAATGDWISWKAIDDHTAEATLRSVDQTVSGKFFFNESGDMTGFSALRYHSEKYPGPLQWEIRMDKYRLFHGLRLPGHFTVSWKLPEGDHTWMEFDLTKLDYDKPYLFDRHYHKPARSVMPLANPSGVTNADIK